MCNIIDSEKNKSELLSHLQTLLTFVENMPDECANHYYLKLGWNSSDNNIENGQWKYKSFYAGKGGGSSLPPVP